MNIKDQRAIGEYWEEKFMEMINNLQMRGIRTQRDKSVASKVRLSTGQDVISPDITIITPRVEHHEIKHKNPTRGGAYGLEVYRFNSLLSYAKDTDTIVCYTIHDWKLAGASCAKEQTDNNIKHWVTADVEDLRKAKKNISNKFPSIVNGRWKENVPQMFWDSSIFQQIKNFWGLFGFSKDIQDWQKEYAHECQTRFRDEIPRHLR